MNIIGDIKKYIFLNPTGEIILFNTENYYLVNSNSWGSPRTWGIPRTWGSPKQGLPLCWDVHSLLETSRGES